MKMLRSALLLALLSGPAALASADPRGAPQEATAQPLPAAREVIERYASACNLKDTLAKTRSMHAKGKFVLGAMGLEGTHESWKAKPALQRVSTEMGGFGAMLAGCDGQVAWMSHPMVGVRLLQGTELLQARLESAYDAALKTGEAFESVATIGRETFEGKECWKLEVVARPLAGMDPEKTRAARTSHEFYEVESGLLLGLSGRLESDLASGPYTQVFADYKDFGGLRLPAKTTVRQGAQEYVLTVDSVAFDTAGAETFQPPPEVQKMLEAASAKPAPAAKPQ